MPAWARCPGGSARPARKVTPSSSGARRISHARQQNLAERERSLKDRDEQLRTREQGMKERQTRVTGKGLGATDYTDEIHIQNRR